MPRKVLCILNHNHVDLETTLVTTSLGLSLPQVLEEEQLGMKQELEEVHASAATAEEELSDTQVRRQKLDHN